MAKKKAAKPRQKPKTNGQAKKRAEWEPSPRQLQIYAELHRGDVTQTDVGRKFGTTQKNVSVIKRRVEKWLVPQYVDSIREMRVEHTQRLMHIYAEAMKAWEASKQPAVEVTESESDTRGGVQTRKTTEQVGNPAFLSQARAAMNEIREMWGANAPIEVRHSAEVRVAGMSLDQAIMQKQNQLTMLRDAIGQGEDNIIEGEINGG